MPETNLEQDQARSFYGSLQSVRVLVRDANLSLIGIQDLNGDTGVEGHRVAAFAQADPTEDGIYIMKAGAWSRTDDACPGFDIGGMLFVIDAGDDIGELWGVVNEVGAGIVGTHDLSGRKFADGDPSGFANESLFVWQVNGTLGSATSVDGARSVLGPGRITRVGGILQDRGGLGGDGQLLLDIRKGSAIDPPLDEGEVQYDLPSATIYTTPANRPTVPGGNPNDVNAIFRAHDPDVLLFQSGDFFEIDITETAPQSKGLTVFMVLRYD
jgi:hypothetical protein